MTIDNLLKDYGTTQKHIREKFKVSKGLVSRWANKAVPPKRYEQIKKHLLKDASDFISKYA